MNKDKSVLDGLKLVCTVCGKTSEEHTKMFPCGVAQSLLVGQHGGPSHFLKIVSYCSSCNAPIYGPEEVHLDSQLVIRRSCDCLPLNKSTSIQNLMDTK